MSDATYDEVIKGGTVIDGTGAPARIADIGIRDGKIVVIDDGQEDTQRSFSFVTTVGMYDANDNLLAVAKLSRPIEKNDEKDLTVRVRLDF